MRKKVYSHKEYTGSKFFCKKSSRQSIIYTNWRFYKLIFILKFSINNLHFRMLVEPKFLKLVVISVTHFQTPMSYTCCSVHIDLTVYVFMIWKYVTISIYSNWPIQESITVPNMPTKKWITNIQFMVLKINLYLFYTLHNAHVQYFIRKIIKTSRWYFYLMHIFRATAIHFIKKKSFWKW